MHSLGPNSQPRSKFEANGRYARVTFDGKTVRIHREDAPTTELPLDEIAAVEFRSATVTHRGWIRFVRRGDARPEEVDFSEWREGGFARLRDALQRPR